MPLAADAQQNPNRRARRSPHCDQNQGECEHAYGSLEHVFDADALPAAAQFLDLFDGHDDVEPSFTLAGALPSA